MLPCTEIWHHIVAYYYAGLNDFIVLFDLTINLYNWMFVFFYDDFEPWLLYEEQKIYIWFDQLVLILFVFLLSLFFCFHRNYVLMHHCILLADKHIFNLFHSYHSGIAGILFRFLWHTSNMAMTKIITANSMYLLMPNDCISFSLFLFWFRLSPFIHIFTSIHRNPKWRWTFYHRSIFVTASTIECAASRLKLFAIENGVWCPD